MKTKNFRLVAMALVACMGVFTACNDDDYVGGGDDGNGTVVENNGTLEGSITSDLTLKSGNTYNLNGEFIIKAGATLNIEPGVKIVKPMRLRASSMLMISASTISPTATTSKG